MKKTLVIALSFMILVSCEESRKIENVKEWSNLLIGKWEYEREYEYNDNLELRFGEVEYFSDSTFIKTVRIKFYFSHGKSKGDEDFVGGGVVKGNWYIDEKNLRLVENINYCNINHSRKTSDVNKEYNSCKWEYKDKTYIYGDNLTDYKTSKLISFWEKYIKTEAIYFKTDGIEIYSASKIN